MINKKAILRLTRLATFLKSIPAKQFDFATVVAECDGKKCGTVACAMGWLPAISSKFKWETYKEQNKEYGYGYQPDLMVKKPSYDGKYSWEIWSFKDIAEYFSISENDAKMLFEPREAQDAPWNKKHTVNSYSSNFKVANSIQRYINFRKNSDAVFSLYF